MYCDSVHMQEVLRNLIKNATEAMEQNGHREYLHMKPERLSLLKSKITARALIRKI